MGRRQVVRHQVLVLAFGGSNPSVPAKLGFSRDFGRFPPDFSMVLRSKTQMFSGGETEKEAAVGCTFWDFRNRFEPSISLARTFFSVKSPLAVMLQIELARWSQLRIGSTHAVEVRVNLLFCSSSDFFSFMNSAFLATYVSRSISWSR